MKSITLPTIILAVFLSAFNTTQAATVTPIINDFGNVFPTLTEANLDNVITGAAPWYVSFNLLARADVRLGTLSQTVSNNGSSFNVTAIRLVKMDGSNVAFGTDTFVNPFNSTIDRLVSVDALAAGQYALEVSGVGNRTRLSFGGTFDATDFIVRLQVLPSAVPLPAAVWLFGSGLIGLACITRRTNPNIS